MSACISSWKELFVNVNTMGTMGLTVYIYLSEEPCKQLYSHHFEVFFFKPLKTQHCLIYKYTETLTAKYLKLW